MRISAAGARIGAAVVLMALVGWACSGSDGDSGGDGGSGAGGGTTQVGRSADGDARKAAPAAAPVSDEALEGSDYMVETASGSADSAAGGGSSSGSGGSDASGSSGGGQRGALGAPVLGPRVIKTASVRVEVGGDDFDDRLQAAVNTAGDSGGYVLRTETQGDVKHRRAVVVLRVPAEAFEAALGELKSLGKVTSETVSGQDVTEEFVDLEARLRNLRAQEAVLLRLMDSAESITDTIRIQNELTPIQLEVERLRGRLRFLDDQTALSTLKLNLSEAGAIPVRKAHPKPGAIAQAWADAKRVSVAVVSAVIVGAGFVFPVGLLLALLFLVTRAIRPRLSA